MNFSTQVCHRSILKNCCPPTLDSYGILLKFFLLFCPSSSMPQSLLPAVARHPAIAEFLPKPTTFVTVTLRKVYIMQQLIKFRRRIMIRRLNFARRSQGNGLCQHAFIALIICLLVNECLYIIWLQSSPHSRLGSLPRHSQPLLCNSKFDPGSLNCL